MPFWLKLSQLAWMRGKSLSSCWIDHSVATGLWYAVYQSLHPLCAMRPPRPPGFGGFSRTVLLGAGIIWLPLGSPPAVHVVSRVWVITCTACFGAFSVQTSETPALLLGHPCTTVCIVCFRMNPPPQRGLRIFPLPCLPRLMLLCRRQGHRSVRPFGGRTRISRTTLHAFVISWGVIWPMTLLLGVLGCYVWDLIFSPMSFLVLVAPPPSFCAWQRRTTSP